MLVSVVFLVVWLGFLASVVWQVWHEYDREHAPAIEGDKPPPWTRFEARNDVRRRFCLRPGGSDTQFFNGVIGLVGTVAVFGWITSKPRRSEPPATPIAYV